MSVSFSGDRGAAVEQLLYRSHSVNGAASALEMSDILDEARSANARDGITGVLTVISGDFIQIVEGDETALDGLMERLARDARHTRIEVLERRPVSERAFADWEMISPRLVAEEVDRLHTLLRDRSAKLDVYLPVLEKAVARQSVLLQNLRPSASDVEPTGV